MGEPAHVLTLPLLLRRIEKIEERLNDRFTTLLTAVGIEQKFIRRSEMEEIVHELAGEVTALEDRVTHLEHPEQKETQPKA